jgi:hypothetical protein
MMRVTSALVCGLAIAMLGAAPAVGGIEPLPPRTEIDAFTCRELLVLQPEMQERALIYLSGVADGRRAATVYDAEATGAAIDRMLAACRATPSLAVLGALRAASR